MSVTEIAAAAGVAEKTVYNYFPVKADMFFDEASDILAELLAAVRCRAAGQPVLAAVGTFMAGRAEWAAGRRPAQPTGRFRQLIANSTALQAHQRLMFGRYESALASLLAAHPPRRPERQPEQLTFSCRARVVDRYGWLAQITAAGEPVTDSC